MTRGSGLSVAVSIPTFNGGLYLRDSVASALRQTYPNLNVLVIDGGSTDGSIEIIKAISDKRLTVIQADNAGSPCRAIKRCLEVPTEDVVIPLMADDFFVSDLSVEKLVEGLSDAEFAYGDALYVLRDKPQKIVREVLNWQFSEADLKSGFHPCWASVAFRRDLISVLEFNTHDFKFACDFDFYLKIFCHGGLRMQHVNFATAAHRLGGASTSSLKNIFLASVEAGQCWELNGLTANRWFPLVKILNKFRQFKL